MTYECHFKVALIGLGNDSSTAYLLTPSGRFVRLSEENNELTLPNDDQTVGEIDSNRDGSYGMPR
ncbi:MAG: hypothetical protein JST85_04385 [Acidobacteria bacterium]|nr:hypothetical protein [Acidobacteriota bacterium]